MKIFLALMFFSFSINIFAQGLKCSSNGTDVYYINGFLTNKDKNKDDTSAINELFKFKQNQIDLGSKVFFTGIHNPSFGLVNDTAELFAQSYYAKNGSNENAKAIFNLIQNIPEKVGLVAFVYSPSIFSTAVNFFGFSSALNIATLQSIAKEDIQTSLSRSLASAETLVPENEKITKSIADAVIKSKQGNRKILFVAHSQGNAALVAGIKKLTVANVNSEVDYMEKYMGAFHVASPVKPLSKTDFKSRDIRTNQDKVISIADFFSRNFIPVEFQITPADVTHEVTARPSLLDSDISGHLFYDTYISQNVTVRSLSSAGLSGKMSDVFTGTLSELATELEDNCEFPDLDFNISGSTRDIFTPGTFIYNGFTNRNNKVSVTVTDKNDDDDSTTYVFRYEGKTVEDVKSISDLSIPYSNVPLDEATPLNTIAGYGGEVTATNKFGKEITRQFRVRVLQDKPPVVIMINQQCYPDCGFGCEHNSVPYTAQLNIQDSDSGAVNGISMINSESGIANYLISNYGSSADPISLVFRSSFLGVTNFTIPACSL